MEKSSGCAAGGAETPNVTPPVSASVVGYTPLAATVKLAPVVLPPTAGSAADPPAAWKATSDTGEAARAAPAVPMPLLHDWITENALSGTA